MTQQQLIQQEKLASIGRLSAGIAHEINNPLGYISSNVETARVYFKEYQEMMSKYRDFVESLEERTIKPPNKTNNLERLDTLNNEIKDLKDLENIKNINFISEDLLTMFDDIESGLERITKIVSSLKAFSRNDDKIKFEEYNVNESIKNTLLIAKNHIKYNARLEENLSEIPNIQASGNKIDQVFLNIILNASSAIKEKQGIENQINEGVISITTDLKDSYIRCIIEDNGIGIEENNLNKIFDPFYTSKSTGEGTGLGLSIAYEIIVTGHKGQLIVESTPMVGTKFIILLPLEQIDNSDGTISDENTNV